MHPERLEAGEIAKLLESWPDELCDLALELRDLVLAVGPHLAETVAFKTALCYYKPNQPYGVIGGNVCMIGSRGDVLDLGFIHGASLPDPEGLLQGTAKAKRYIELRSRRDIRRRAFRKLIRAAIDYQPGAE
jgi:hypothetical protein